MTIKASLAGLNLGGAKCALWRDKSTEKRNIDLKFLLEKVLIICVLFSILISIMLVALTVHLYDDRSETIDKSSSFKSVTIFSKSCILLLAEYELNILTATSFPLNPIGFTI